MRKIKFMAMVMATMLYAVFVSCGEDKEELQMVVENTGDNTNDNSNGSGSGNNSDESDCATEKSGVIDLGLSVKWATCNVGADAPEIIGDYYAWGETSTKNEYTDATYFDSEYSIYTISGKNKISGTSHDVARVKLGEDWRMPTTDEIIELVNACSWKEEELNGIMGMRGTASNGNSIFFPITGMFAGNTIQSKNQGCYWGGELYKDATLSSRFSSILTFFKGGEVRCSNYYRFEGMAIRPVFIGTGEDDNSQEPPVSDENPEDNLPADTEGFVGYWLHNDYALKNPNIYLSADGICMIKVLEWSNGHAYDSTASGYWSYDEDVRYLATTISFYQYTVTLLNGTAWAGVRKSGSKSYNNSWRKASNYGAALFLKDVATWVKSDGTIANLKNYSISEDENVDDYVFNYSNG